MEPERSRRPTAVVGASADRPSAGSRGEEEGGGIGMAGMENRELKHLYPTLEMLAEELNRAGLACRVERGAGPRGFRGARRFSPHAMSGEDVLSVLGPEDVPRFRGSGRACVSTAPVESRGGCILCLNHPAEEVLDALLGIFERCRDMEARLDELVYRNADLRQLCELGADMLDNPICIHDDWFVMIARSSELSQVLPPDYVMSSSKEFIPRVIVEDFKNDSEYLETYAHRTAHLWDPGPEGPRCIYDNLWEGRVYRGRLLVVEYRRELRKLDYAISELLAQRAMTLMRRDRPGPDRSYRSMDDIVLDLLNARQPEAREERRMLDMLGWSRGDPLLCVRLEPQQQSESALMEHALHNDLFQAFPQGYILFSGHQQCVLLNLRREGTNLPMLRHRLSPLCRDYCLYAGMSSPVAGIGELSVAYQQAKVALEKAFQLRGERWVIPFADCALEYMLRNVQGAMALRHLVAPELYRLIEYDRERDTQYFETLRAYLLNERDIPRTSQALIIHRTTLLYRLRKLQSVAPIDLDDPAKRLQLLLSLWILDRQE